MKIGFKYNFNKLINNEFKNWSFEPDEVKITFFTCAFLSLLYYFWNKLTTY